VLEPATFAGQIAGSDYARVMSAGGATGGCLCGGVRYEIAGPLGAMTYCHCTRCQRRTGTAASVQVRIEPGSLRVVQGEELVRGWKPPDGFEKCFCSTCGGQLFSRDSAGNIRGVRMSTLDEDPGLTPAHRQYVAYAATWEAIPDDGVPRFPEAAA
jgi:hypothetical protein